MNKLMLLVLLTCFAVCGFSYEKRDLLQKEAKEMNLAQALGKDFSDIGFPDFNNRNFWNNLPENLSQQYI